MNPSEQRGMIVTIDGPAGAGKSTVARELAQRLGADFLDTGAMYRAVAAEAIGRQIDPADEDALGRLVQSLAIRFDFAKQPPAILVDGRDLSHRLRDADVTAGVSAVAGNVQVRQVLVRAQRLIGAEHPNLVTEGRDQGSVVFPGALVKFYLDASAEVRARRRAEQLRQMGRAADEALILRQIIDRDHRDRSRSDGPLVCPADAIRIDSSNMSLDEVVQTLFDHVQRAKAER